PYTGGRNMFLEGLERAIARDIDAQKANLANQRAALGERRGIIAELVSTGMTEFQAAEAARLAAYTLVDRQLALEAAKYDPAGTLAQRIRQHRAEVQQKLAAGRTAAEKQLFDQNLAAEKIR